MNNIERKLARLEKFPELGGVPSDPDLAAVGYRFLVIGNYLIFYTLEPRSVLIHRILHGARDYRQLLLQERFQPWLEAVVSSAVMFRRLSRLIRACSIR